MDELHGHYEYYIKRADINLYCIQRSIKTHKPHAALAMAEALVRNLRDACMEHDYAMGAIK
jgi:hypothetical protein